MKICIDTNIYSAFKNGNPEIIELLENADEVYIPSIVLGELYAGLQMGSKLKDNIKDVKVEKGPNLPFVVGKMQTGYYDFIVISPVTGNTVAKIVYGIADSLISNGVAQALKGGQKVYLFPTDQQRENTTTVLPSGKTFKLKHRKVDLENIEKLRQMDDVIILYTFFDIYDILKDSF